MYVAAPIISDGRIIGVLTVGKPNAAMAPVIKRSERRILWASAVLLGIALAIGAGMVWWINRSIARLTRYADSVTENRPLALPALGSSELRKLAQALESMRIKLEGKNEIEQYVYALTHELKVRWRRYAARRRFCVKDRPRMWLPALQRIYWRKIRECRRW